MISLDDFVVNHYLNVSTRPYPDYVKVAYLLEVVQELAAEVAALKGQQQPVEQGAYVWPPSPLICHCEDFVGEGFECERCGGGRF